MPPLTFLIVSDEGLGERLADGVDLAGVAAALHADADVDVGEAVLAQEQDRLLQLVLQGRRLHQLQGAAVDLKGGEWFHRISNALLSLPQVSFKFSKRKMPKTAKSKR